MRILLPWTFYLTNLTFTNSYVIYLVNRQRLCCLQTWHGFHRRKIVFFLFYKQVDVSRFEVYWAINSILNNNISNFYDRCGVDFNQHFNKDLRLLLVRPMNDNFFTFGVNKRIASEHEGNLKMDGGKRVTYECVMQPHMVPVYGYMQTSYNRDQINLDEWSHVITNVEQEDRTLWKGHSLKSGSETWDPRPGTLIPEIQDPETLRPKTLGPGTLRLGTLRQWNWDPEPWDLRPWDMGSWQPGPC